MEKYYKLQEEKVIDTVTTIPENMWERKGILPYEEVLVFEETESEKENTESIEILANKVIKTITKYRIPKTLDEIKAEKKSEIAIFYSEKSNEGFTCSNSVKLDCRETDKINWLTLKMNLSANPETTTIRDFDNVVREIPATEIIIMLNELEDHYKNLLYSKWVKQKEADDCSTEEQINLIVLE